MSETRVNTDTTNDQHNPQVIQLAGGDYLIAWTSGANAVGQMFSASGAAVGGNVVLASGVNPVNFTVSAAADGGFLTAWSSAPSSGSAYGDITVQRFDGAGARVGDPVRVTETAARDHSPTVTPLEGGGFAVAWVEETYDGYTQSALKLQLFGADGSPVSATVTVDTHQITGAGSVHLHPRNPSIDQLADGQVVLAWAKSGYGYHGYVEGKVLIQRFDLDGQAAGSRIESHVHDPNRTQTVSEPSVVATPDGGFAVAWHQQGGYFPAQPTSYAAVVRKYAADGSIENHWSAESDWRSSVDLTLRPDGGFTLAYSGSSTSEVYLQAFDANGAAVSDAILVNSTTEGVQDQPDVAVLADGGYAVAWRSDDGHQGGVWYTEVGGDPPSGEGQVINSPGPGSTLTGGAGNDTLNASQGSDVLTGGGGADVFAWAREPWSPAKVMDFTLGEDRLDISALLQAAGYAGSDPVADKYVTFVSVPGGTGVLFDRDGAGSAQPWGNYIINLQGVNPYQVTWGQLAGGEATPEFTLAGSLTLAEGDSGLTGFTFTVTRSGSTSDAGVVNWFVRSGAGDSAEPDDFSGGLEGRYPAGQAHFAAGETSKTITVNVVGDTAVEGDETFTVDLVSSSGGTIGAQRQAFGTIRNDDSSDPPPSGEGQVINSPGPGSTLTGGSGNDTLNASQGSDVLTGGGGADVFAWAKEPWSPATVTDFLVGTDRLDLSALFQAAGYSGSDPIADGRVVLMDRDDDTLVLFDDDGAGGDWPNYIITLEGVESAGLTWAQLSTGGSPPPGEAGEVLSSDQYGDTLVGGAGNDTLNAGRGPDQLTGAGGADRFVWAEAPWNAGHVTDFTPGTDVLDLSRLLGGYAGSDPIADGYVEFRAAGGSTQVYVDIDGPGRGDWPWLVTTLDGVSPGQIGSGDWVFR